jgi:glycosyltransferase involved in cell wall biosynthesis
VELFQRASIYISAVPSDGVSSSLLEAMSAGLIPVVIDNGPNREWLTGTSDGHLVPAGDVQALGMALEGLFRGNMPAEDVRAHNRERVVARADRRTNLGTMLGWWRDLVEARR